MTASTSQLKILRQQLASFSPIPKDRWSFSLWPEGIPRGILWEITGPLGSGKTEIAFQFFFENINLCAAWIEETLNIYPPRLCRQQRPTPNILFVEAGAHLLWVSLQVIQSQTIPIVVLYKPHFSEKQLRQLQLICGRYLCTVILLTEEAFPQASWPIHLRHQVRRPLPHSPPLLEKYKGKRP
jgi:hypothetical protein